MKKDDIEKEILDRYSQYGVLNVEMLGKYIIENKVYKKESYLKLFKTFLGTERDFDRLWLLLKEYCPILLKEDYGVEINNKIDDDELCSYVVLYYFCKNPDTKPLPPHLRNWIGSILESLLPRKSGVLK